MERAGENPEGGGEYRCPGESCRHFRRTKGATWEERAKNACTGCTECNGNFPINPDEKTETASDDDVSEIVEAVEDIVQERKSGFYFEFDPELFDLVLTWERIERQIEQKQRVEMLILLKNQNEILKAGLRVETK